MLLKKTIFVIRKLNNMQEGTENDFERLVKTYSTVLLNKAYYLLSNKEDAEDIVQDVFISAYISYHNYDGKGTILSWLMGILYNKVMDLYRKRYKHEDKMHINFSADFDKHGEWNHTDVSNYWFGEDKSEQENLLDNIDFRKQFYACLESLPDRWRTAVKLCYLDENKAEYICSELGISTTNYWKLLQRSRLQLRRCIDAKWFNV